MPRVTSVPLTDLIVAFVTSGAGVGILSRWAAEPYRARGEIVCRRFTKGGVPERWYALTRREAKDAGHVRRFIELMTTVGAGAAVPREASRARRASGPKPPWHDGGRVRDGNERAYTPETESFFESYRPI